MIVSWVVINHKTTKFESNSQLVVLGSLISYCCYQSQNYKIWKQFTTSLCIKWWICRLLSITKLQNLKAIHNTIILTVQRYKVVINHKTTKFESNSQRFCVWRLPFTCCYQSQNYKIWKQFTTVFALEVQDLILLITSLLSITKLQNLKAIHNQHYF